MTKKDFHHQFDTGTKTKLYIFNQYFKESFPVFIHSNVWSEILVYDFFAGKGYDETGEKGTSINILEQIKPYCSLLLKKKKNLYVILNDRDEKEELEKNVNLYLDECRKNCLINCIFSDKNLKVFDKDFDTYFGEVYPKIQKHNDAAKLIFLDPFKFILDDKKFLKLIDLKSTDFLCFMPSSFLRRFRDLPSFNKFIDTKKLDYDNTLAAHCHRVIADYFKSLIPKDKEYYIGAFSIKKGSNYYGLIFGTNHSLGAEKFQRVCWAVDKLAGAADYNIDRELGYNNPNGILFEEIGTPLKIRNFKEKLQGNILNGTILTDVDAYKFALKERCQLKHASEVLKTLADNNKIKSIETIQQDLHKHRPIVIKLL